MSAVTGRVFVAVDLNAESQSRGDFKYQCLAGSALVADKAATPGCNSTFFIFHSTFACRLVRAQELVAPTNRNPYTVTYAYDHRGRMVRKDVFCSGNSPFSILHYTFVWDGWNIIRETQWPVTSDQWSAGPLATNHYPLVTDYVWGLDLNGALQGAGGVGGLLAVLRSDCAITNSAFCILHSALYLPTYDANGNVSEYIDERGEVVAHYDYSPFGETLIESGDLASSFPHRFSTKPWCSVTGLCEYQMRKYRPEIGRWMSRDPMRDYNEINEQGFVGNKAVERIDYIGLAHIINNASEPILAVGNVGISDSCRKYLMENIKGLKLGKHGINGVLFILFVGEKSKDNKNITDIDGYWTTFSPGTPGHVKKIRLSHTIGDDNLSGKTGDTISAKFLGGASISDWIANTLEGVYQKHIINGREKCKCTDSDIANINFAIFSSLEASLYFYEAK